VTEPVFIGIILGLKSFGPILFCYDFITDISYDFYLPVILCFLSRWNCHVPR